MVRIQPWNLVSAIEAIDFSEQAGFATRSAAYSSKPTLTRQGSLFPRIPSAVGRATELSNHRMFQDHPQVTIPRSNLVHPDAVCCRYKNEDEVSINMGVSSAWQVGWTPQGLIVAARGIVGHKRRQMEISCLPRPLTSDLHKPTFTPLCFLRQFFGSPRKDEVLSY
ncbi:hypothetical protein J6590_057150 [Homalodisca vitripennis]|nr:hypothetical protein J6590_057150 [Homalodisca vitripennis]